MLVKFGVEDLCDLELEVTVQFDQEGGGGSIQLGIWLGGAGSS